MEKKLTGEEIIMSGLTLRQWYAGMAMQGMISAGHISTTITPQALEIADAMVETLNDTPNPNA